MSGLLVADTDLVIDFLRGAGPGSRLLPQWLRDQRLRLTAVTLFELRSGRDWDSTGHHVEALFVGGPLPFDRASALQAGRIEHLLRAEGRRIGVADVQQAGICNAGDLPLATRNVKHFSRIPGLELVDLEG